MGEYRNVTATLESLKNPLRENRHAPVYIGYEQYKQYLNTLDLTPKEYEQKIKQYCRKNNI